MSRRPRQTMSEEFKKVMVEWERKRFRRFIEISRKYEGLLPIDLIKILNDEMPEPNQKEFEYSYSAV